MSVCEKRSFSENVIDFVVSAVNEAEALLFSFGLLQARIMRVGRNEFTI